MLSMKNFIIDSDKRKENQQYLYFREEADGTINSGTTSVTDRYSVKTPPKSVRYVDVSSFLPCEKNNRPDNEFHKWLSSDRGWLPVRGNDVFDKSLDEMFSAFLDFYSDKTGIGKTISKIKPREFQKEGIQILIKWIRDPNNFHYLFEAPTGYGKTCSIFCALLETKHSDVVIITQRQLVIDAFIKDFKLFGLDKESMCLITPDRTYGDLYFAKQIIRIVPDKRNKLIKSITPNTLFLIDEAHLSASSQKSQEFFKDKKVIYITATGNKLTNLVQDSYFFGLSDIAEAKKKGYITDTQFPIPTFDLNTKFAEKDFGKINGLTDEEFDLLISDITTKNNGQNAIIRAQGFCANAYNLYKKTNIHKNVKWYIAADGKNSSSYANGKKAINGKDAIHAFDYDCKSEPNLSHILITIYQGKESYSYHELNNIFFLCDHASQETFFQLLGRLMREKKNSQTNTATFFVYCPFLEFYTFLDTQFREECKKRKVPYSQEEFDDFIKLFKYTIDGIPHSLDAVTVCESLSTRGSLVRYCSEDDFRILSEVFNGTSGSGNNSQPLSIGTRTNINSNNAQKNLNTNSVFEDESEDNSNNLRDPNESKKDKLDLKERFELLVSRLPFFIKYLEMERDKKGNKDLQNFVFPSCRDQLVNLPILNFQRLVYDHFNEQKIQNLFSKLGDDTIGVVLKRLTSNKNKDIKDLPYATFGHIKFEYTDSRIRDPSILLNNIEILENDTVLNLSTGIEVALELQKIGCKQLYISDIVAHKVLCDYYDIPFEFVKSRKINGKINIEESWSFTFKEEFKKMKFFKSLLNPPYGDLHLKILAGIVEEIVIKNNGELVSIQPDKFLVDVRSPYNKSLKKKYEMSKKLPIYSVKQIPADEASKLFGTGQFQELAVINCKNGGNFDINSLRQPKIKRIFDIIRNNYTIKKAIKDTKTTEWFVGLAQTHGHVGKKDFYDIVSPNRKVNQLSMNSNIGTMISKLYFNSKNEAENFINSLYTIFMKFCNSMTKVDNVINYDYLPFMGNYTEPWTNERFYKHFNITEEEQKIIEVTIKDIT